MNVFVAGTPIYASDVNDNYQEVLDKMTAGEDSWTVGSVEAEDVVCSSLATGDTEYRILAYSDKRNQSFDFNVLGPVLIDNIDFILSGYWVASEDKVYSGNNKIAVLSDTNVDYKLYFEDLSGTLHFPNDRIFMTLLIRTT